MIAIIKENVKQKLPLKYKSVGIFKLGVPCSRLKDYIKDVEIHCTSEAQAMGIAAGLQMMGKQAGVYLQNSGLPDIIDCVLSLYKPYKIPLPKLLLSIRCKPEHHQYMGAITKDLLKLINYDGEIDVVEEYL